MARLLQNAVDERAAFEASLSQAPPFLLHPIVTVLTHYDDVN